MKNLKDKKIGLYRKVTDKDADGFPVTKYIPVDPGSIWAYVRQLSASEFYAAKAVQQTEEMLFSINWRQDIVPEWFIGYKGVFYSITRVDTYEGYKEDLKLYAVKMQPQPKPGDIMPY